MLYLYTIFSTTLRKKVLALTGYEYLTAPGEYVCYCGKVTEAAIIAAIDNGARTIAEVIKATGAKPADANCAKNNPNGR